MRRRFRLRRPSAAGLATAGLALGSLVVSVLVSRLVVPNFSVNNDEPVYVFQARLLTTGRLTMPTGPLADFMRPWMSGPVDGRLVMVFPPVLPALLAVGDLVLGSMRAVLGLLAAAGVLLVHRLAREVTGRTGVAAVAAGLLAVCPLFVIQSGLFLSYVLGLDLVLLVAVLLVVASRRPGPGWAVAAGLALGVLAFARPLDAVLAGVPLVATALVAHTPESRRAGAGPGVGRNRRRRLVAIAAGASPAVALIMAYDRAVTGSPLRIPLAAIGGDNALGFGLRHMANGTRPVRYDLGQALWATGVNLGSLPAWLPGGLLLVALAVAGLVSLRRQPWAWGLAALAVTFPLGYLCYWGNLLVVQGRLAIGPHYYLSVLVPLVVLGATGLARLWSARRTVAVALVAVLVGTAALSVDDAVRLNRRQVALHGRERQLLADAELRHAVVIVPAPLPDGAWLGHPRPTFTNHPDPERALASPVLFAADLAGRNFELVDRFPDRTFVRQFSRTPAGLARPAPQPVLWPLRPVRGDVVRFRVRITNHDGRPVLSAYLTDGTRTVSYVIDHRSVRGRSYDLTWVVSPTGITLEGAPEPAWERTLAAPTGAGTLAVGVSSGPSEQRRDAALVESRFWYRVRPGGPLELMLPGEAWRKGAGPTRRWLDLDLPHTYAVEVSAA